MKLLQINKTKWIETSGSWGYSEYDKFNFENLRYDLDVYKSADEESLLFVLEYTDYNNNGVTYYRVAKYNLDHSCDKFIDGISTAISLSDIDRFIKQKTFKTVHKLIKFIADLSKDEKIRVVLCKLIADRLIEELIDDYNKKEYGL